MLNEFKGRYWFNTRRNNNNYLNYLTPIHWIYCVLFFVQNENVYKNTVAESSALFWNNLIVLDLKGRGKVVV